MLLDYLRYLAFEGRLRQFFEEDVNEYVDPEATTGQHLRYSPEYVRKFWNGDWFHLWNWGFHRKYYDSIALFEELKHRMGIEGGPDYLNAPDSRTLDRRFVSPYMERGRAPEVEIIIDIDPDRWTERYFERRSYQEVPVLYRRASAARPNLKTGDKLFSKERGPLSHGTLCGIFHTADGRNLALTCRHVTKFKSTVMIENRRRFWGVPIGRLNQFLGVTDHVAMQAELDAALIAVESTLLTQNSSKAMHRTECRPISTLLQEEPVRFRGASRATDTLARVLAIAVRKSIDLEKNGELRSVGDVLMLGHRFPMYVAQRVSRPGDSGAAVQHDLPLSAPEDRPRWSGMILGSDEGGAYATHAEHLWAWAVDITKDQAIEFALET